MAVAELGYKIGSDGVKQAETRLDGMDKAANRADRSSDKLSNTSNRLAKSLGVAVGSMIAFAAAAISIGTSIRTLAQFEDGMARLGAITRASEADLAKLRDTAKELGATTEFSATQAADGLTFLGQAGFTAAESMAAIPAVLDLATASGLGLAQAADTASNIMSGFGIAADQAAQVSDVLAAAASRANTNVSQLGSAMSTVAPIASALGIDLETTAAAIGVMSDAGIQGERAGTALRGVLASLAGPTQQAADALSKYGLTAADVDPQVNGLANVFETLRERGLSTADAMQIFGREAASGALVLIESASRVGEFSDELSRADGEASRMAETMRSSLGGSIKTLQSSLEALILAMGEAGLTAVIKGLISISTGLVRAFTKVAENADILAVAIGLLATSRIPALVLSLRSLVVWLGTAEGLFIAGAIAARGMAVAMNLIPGAIILTALSAAITGLIRGFRRSAEAAREFSDATSGLADEQEKLNKLTTDFYDNMNEASLEALRTQAARNVDMISTALAAAEAELDAAGWYTRAFGVELFDTERMARARDAIDKLKGDLVEAENRLSAADHAATSLDSTLSNVPDTLDGAAESTSRWELLMMRVKIELNSIASVISQLGGGAISAAAKQTEIAALRAGNSIKDAAIAASEFQENLRVDAQVAGLESRFGVIGKAIGGLVRGQVEYNRELDRTLDTERQAAIEREKAALDSGGGGAAGNTRIQQLIESLQTEQEVIAQWYAQSQLDLIMATDAELELIGGRNEAKLRLEMEYQERLAGIRGASADRTLSDTATLFGALQGIAQAGGDKLVKVATVAGAIQATINSYVAATEALKTPGLSLIGRIAAYATVLATGLQAVSSIKSAGRSSGGGGGGGGGRRGLWGRGADDAAQSSTQAPPQTRAIIQATGGRTRFTVDEINDIIAGIQKESKDGVIIEGFTS